MQDLEKITKDTQTISERKNSELTKPDLDYSCQKREEFSSSGFAVSFIATGTFMYTMMEGISAKIFGGLFIAGGISVIWAEGYSPIKIAKEITENIGALVCLPYNFSKRLYNRKKA